MSGHPIGVSKPWTSDFFFQKYGLNEADLERYLAAALSAGGDYADLYFEYLTSTALGLDESLVKSASQGISAGCGVRVISGERTGYAYTDDLAPERILHAARTAALIAQRPGEDAGGEPEGNTALATCIRCRRRSTPRSPTKLELVMRADRAARAYDPRIKEVRAGYADELRRILVIGSDGTFAEDVQPLARLNVLSSPATGETSAPRARSAAADGTSRSLSRREKTPEHFAREAARQAILQLDAATCPAGEMEVVLGPGWPGVLLHEAIGHGLEADFNRKKTSAFAGLHGQARGQRQVHGGGQRHHARPPRLAQRGRRGQPHAATRC